MMFEQGLKELELISKEVGNRIDYVQGGGGNTSVKLDNEYMAVKASGFKLNQITPTQGYVVVDYANIKNYYENVDLNLDIDYEKESVEIAKKNILEIGALPVLRPSVEAGFHSFMKKYVIHTHPVYVNILCCSMSGREMVEEIFEGKDYECLWIPYINPGFCLTLKIKEAIGKCIKEAGRYPEVIFMENHGLVVTADSYERALYLHEEVNNLILQHFELNEKYPSIDLEKLDDGTFKSKTTYLNSFFCNKSIDLSFFEKYALYPDQLVYLNNSLSLDGPQNKLNINTISGERLYKTNYSEAITIEETLLGYVYVIHNIEKCELDIKVMTQREIDFIKNWESEAYRKSLVKDIAK